MSKFSELYDADIARYGGKPEAYIKTFLFVSVQKRNFEVLD